MMVRTRSNNDGRECPICMDAVRFGAETNCGHLYCSACILQVWDQNVNTVTCISCPCCRQEVTLLLCCFTAAESSDSRSAEVLNEREHLKDRLQRYNTLHSNVKYSYLRHMKELPTILRHAWAETFTWGGLTWLFKLRIVLMMLAGLLYLLVPFDLIPEAFLGVIGLVDDVMVICFFLVQVSVLFRSHVTAEG
uniref:E3 ubiquitin-protein ligase RNF170 n=1 Tax=Hirondellea gigas TaxID=1518452 RepID=A0A2P2IB50_9CRUS